MGVILEYLPFPNKLHDIKALRAAVWRIVGRACSNRQSVGSAVKFRASAVSLQVESQFLSQDKCTFINLKDIEDAIHAGAAATAEPSELNQCGSGRRIARLKVIDAVEIDFVTTERIFDRYTSTPQLEYFTAFSVPIVVVEVGEIDVPN